MTLQTIVLLVAVAASLLVPLGLGWGFGRYVPALVFIGILPIGLVGLPITTFRWASSSGELNTESSLLVALVALGVSLVAVFLAFLGWLAGRRERKDFARHMLRTAGDN